MSTRNRFANRDNGALVKVTKVDDTFAYMESEDGRRYSMPLADYDSIFVRNFRPATEADLATEEAAVRLPANAPDDWRTVELSETS